MKSNDKIPRDEMRLAIQLQRASESWRKPARRQRRALMRNPWWWVRVTALIEKRREAQ